MVNLYPDDGMPEDLDRIARNADAAREGWSRTVEDTEAMMADREEDGFETLFVPGADTTPKGPDAGDDGEWGLSYVVPGNKVEPFEAFVDASEFTETAVYQHAQGGTVFVVTECIDPERKRSLFVAGAYRMRFAPSLVRTALEEGRMYTLIKRIDGTLVRRLEHESPESFFPEPERFYAYETEEFYGTGE